MQQGLSSKDLQDEDDEDMFTLAGSVKGAGSIRGEGGSLKRSPSRSSTRARRPRGGKVLKTGSALKSVAMMRKHPVRVCSYCDVNCHEPDLVALGHLKKECGAEVEVPDTIDAMHWHRYNDDGSAQASACHYCPAVHRTTSSFQGKSRREASAAIHASKEAKTAWAECKHQVIKLYMKGLTARGITQPVTTVQVSEKHKSRLSAPIKKPSSQKLRGLRSFAAYCERSNHPTDHPQQSSKTALHHTLQTEVLQD